MTFNRKIILSIVLLFSVSVFAEDKTKTFENNLGETKSTDTTPGNPNGTGTATYDNGTGKSTYDNGTGRSTYDNGTGRSTYNTGATITGKDTKGPKVKRHSNKKSIKLTIQGLTDDQDMDKLIDYAKEAKATDAKINGDQITIYGDEFDRDTFNTILFDRMHDVKAF